MNCKEAKSLLTSYLLGDLGDTLASAIRSHIETCKNCSAEAAEIQPTLDLLRDALSDTAPAPAKLDVSRHAAIYQKRPSGKGRIVTWLFESHPRATRVAAVFLAAAFLWFVAGEMFWRSTRMCATLGYEGAELGQDDLALDSSPGWYASSKPAAARADVQIIEPELVEEVEDIKEEFVPVESITSYGGSASVASKPDQTMRYAGGSSRRSEVTAGELTGQPMAPAATPRPSEDFSPNPVFESVAISKSPVIVNGVYSGISSGVRGVAVSASGGKSAKLLKKSDGKDNGDITTTVAEDEDSDSFAVQDERHQLFSVAGDRAIASNGFSADAGSRAREKTRLAAAGAVYAVEKRLDANVEQKPQEYSFGAGVADAPRPAKPERVAPAALDPFAVAAAPAKRKSQSDAFGLGFGGGFGGDTLGATGDELAAVAEAEGSQKGEWKDMSRSFGFDWSKDSSVSRQTASLNAEGPAPAQAAGEKEAVYYRYLPSYKPDSAEARKEAEHEPSERDAAVNKLKKIVLPEIDFRQANINDVVEFLQQQTVAFDNDNSGKAGKGLDISLNLRNEPVKDAVASGPVDPFAAAAPLAASEAGPVAPESDVPLITFGARYITAQEALEIVTSVANLKYRVDKNGAIKIVPKDDPEQEIVLRQYDVNGSVWNFFANSTDSGEKDAAAGAENARNAMAEFGVGWPRGSKVEYMPEVGKVFVANTPDNLVLFERVLGAVEKKVKEEEAREETRFKAYGVNPVINVSENAFSTFSIDVDTASYTLTRNYIEGGSLPPAEAVRTEEIVNFFDYDYKAPSARTFAVYAEAAPSKFGRGQHLLKIGVKGKRLGREEQRRAVLTFLVDTSGSMETDDRIGLVKKSLKMLVGKLGDEDLVSIVQYDSRARLVLAHTKAASRKEIIAAIDSLQCSGSTNLEQGMNKAYEAAAKGFVSKGENRVLILSDGVANLGDLNAEELLAKVGEYRKQGIYCSVFGVGIGAYDDVMLETLANKGDGTYAYLDSEEEAKRLFVDDMASTLNTIARDVKIQVEFNRNLVKTYRQLGYENRQLTKEQFRDDTVDAGEVGSGQSVTALYEIGLQSAISKQGGNKRLVPEPVATVRVRYHRVDNDAVEEIEIPVTFKDFVDDFNKADARFRLAACAAEFAEILRGSPYAQGSDYRDVSKALTPVALELDLDQRVQGFLRMTTSAPGMARGK